MKRLLAKAKGICEAGGDWEHKNKLKVRAPGCDADMQPRHPELLCASEHVVVTTHARTCASVRAAVQRPWAACAPLHPQVYEAVFSMYTRDFKRAASLFLDSIATFTT